MCSLFYTGTSTQCQCVAYSILAPVHIVSVSPILYWHQYTVSVCRLSYIWHQYTVSVCSLSYIGTSTQCQCVAYPTLAPVHSVSVSPILYWHQYSVSVSPILYWHQYTVSVCRLSYIWHKYTVSVCSLSYTGTSTQCQCVAYPIFGTSTQCQCVAYSIPVSYTHLTLPTRMVV